MKYPNLLEEKRLWKKGHRCVAGVDEAGRGCLAGPIVAAAVLIINSKFKYRNSKPFSDFGFRASDLKIRDSKKLTPKAREKFYKILTAHPGILWGIGRVSEKLIDRINILEATKLAMIKALNNLKSKIQNLKLDFIIIDGNFRLNLNIPQRSIIKADEKVFSCAAASILAKVTRDRIMQRYHKKFPHYGFEKHKGYPTKFHLEVLKKYGQCDIHRKSFHYGRCTKTKTY